MNASGKQTLPERILVFPFDLLSHYLRCIELVKRYPGADIFFASSATYNAFVQEAGYTIVPVEQFDAQQVMRCAATFDFSWLNKADIERIFRSQVKAIQSIRPTRVIGDTSPSLKMAAECMRVPYTALMNGYMSRYYSGVRYLPATHPARVILSVFPRVVRHAMVRRAEAISFRRVHKPFRALRQKYGLRYVADYLGEMEGDENLLCDDPQLFPQKQLPTNYTIIGPLMYEGKSTAEDLAALIPPGKKVMLVCMGSSGQWEALRFLASPVYADVLIITAGDTRRVIQGDHVMARPFVPLSAILPKCAVMVCHGGNGTIYHGIKHRVPMLCLTSHFEQEWNVQRLEELQLGQRINTNPQKKIDTFLFLRR